MNIGYARTSTIEQKAGLDAQIRDLKAAGCCERDIHHEQVSSVSERPELEFVLETAYFARRRTIAEWNRSTRWYCAGSCRRCRDRHSGQRPRLPGVRRH